MTELTFGQRIRQLRRELDLTQEGLAEQVSYSVDTIRKLEAGSLRPSRQLAELLATRLGIPDAERADFVAFARAALPPKYVPDSPVVDLSVQASPQIIPYSRVQNAAPDNLPAQPTSFIGREQEIADCVEILSRPEVGLLTLTGVGGTGKTRLALRIAEELKGNLSDAYPPLDDTGNYIMYIDKYGGCHACSPIFVVWYTYSPWRSTPI